MRGNSVRGIVALLVVIMFLPTAVREIGDSIRGASDSALHLRNDGLADVVGAFLTTIVCGLFGLGLLRRCARWLRGHDSAAYRYQQAQERRARIAPRPVSDDVPLYQGEHPVPDDPDPALPVEED